MSTEPEDFSPLIPPHNDALNISHISARFIGFYLAGLLENLADPPTKDELENLKNCFKFINRLCKSPDPALKRIARKAIFPYLKASPKVLKLASKYLDEGAKKVLEETK